jgi:hypothetical protein
MGMPHLLHALPNDSESATFFFVSPPKAGTVSPNSLLVKIAPLVLIVTATMAR